MKDLPFDDDAGALLGITVIHNNSDNRSPDPSSGEVTGRTSKNATCKDKKTGNYCFQNNTDVLLSLTLETNDPKIPYYSQAISIQKGQKQCFYDLPAGQYTYEIQDAYRRLPTYNPRGGGPSYVDQPYHLKGNINIETCQEKQFIIR